jgi:hypothetical protein
MFQICNYSRSDFSVCTCIFSPQEFEVKFRREKNRTDFICEFYWWGSGRAVVIAGQFLLAFFMAVYDFNFNISAFLKARFTRCIR